MPSCDAVWHAMYAQYRLLVCDGQPLGGLTFHSRFVSIGDTSHVHYLVRSLSSQQLLLGSDRTFVIVEDRS